MNQTVRQSSVARQQEQIQSNVAKIEEAKRPSALDIMASRLNVSPVGLKKTLIATAFTVNLGQGRTRVATDEEFMSLVIVANIYNLNPLIKEMYAFPAKGGGIVPIVSIDGWIKIANDHPQMDGFDFQDIPDEKGRLAAVETTIYRKDRNRPIKVVEYLDECRQNTDPWKNMPARMLRHKSFIQCARYAFGLSGIYSDDDAVAGEIELLSDTQIVGMPMRQARQIQHDGKPTEVDEAIARALDEGVDPKTGEVMTGRPDGKYGDQFDGSNNDDRIADGLERLTKAELAIDVNRVEGELNMVADELTDDQAGQVRAAIADARQRLGSQVK